VRYQFGLKFGAVQTPSATPADFRKCIRVHLSTEMLLDTYALPTALSLQGEFTGRIRSSLYSASPRCAISFAASNVAACTLKLLITFPFLESCTQYVCSPETHR
jgi:hypothetical protein